MILNWEKGDRAGPPCQVEQVTHSTILSEPLTLILWSRWPQPPSPIAAFSSPGRSTVLWISALRRPQIPVAFVLLRHAAPEKSLVLSGLHFVHLEIDRCFPGLRVIPNVTFSRCVGAQLSARLKQFVYNLADRIFEDFNSQIWGWILPSGPLVYPFQIWWSLGAISQLSQMKIQYLSESNYGRNPHYKASLYIIQRAAMLSSLRSSKYPQLQMNG